MPKSQRGRAGIPTQLFGSGVRTLNHETDTHCWVKRTTLSCSLGKHTHISSDTSIPCIPTTHVNTLEWSESRAGVKGDFSPVGSWPGATLHPPPPPQRDMQQCLETFLDCPSRVKGMLLASCGQRSGMLLDTLQCTGCPIAQNGPTANSAKRGSKDGGIHPR